MNYNLPAVDVRSILGSLFFILITIKWVTDRRKRANVPGIGYGAFPLFSSWVAAYRFMRDPVGLVEQGINKYKKGYFRIATLQGEYVLVPEQDKIAEYIRAPDTIMSMDEAANDQQQIEWTMGYGVTHRTYHVPVVRNQVTKCVESNMDVMLEEMSRSFDDLIGSPTEFSPFPLYDIIATTVGRTSNRVFVGKVLSENAAFIRNAVDYAQAVVISAELIRPFPDWAKPFLIKLAPVARYRRQAMKFLGETIQARLDEQWRGSGEKPDDLVQWLVDAAPPVEKNVPMLVERVMALNVASIHTTTMTFTSGLYCLAAEPEKYIPELRAEVEEHCSSGNLNRETLAKLVKMDSFLREAGRYNNSGLLSMQRNAKKPFTFSDGTVIPAGAKVGTPILFVTRDPSNYPRGDEFDGFRFAPSSQQQGKDGKMPSNKSLVTTDPTFQLFGHGRHACPGRFFAAIEMKLMFILLLRRYDIKLNPGDAPKEHRIGTMALPDTELKVQLRVKKE